MKALAGYIEENELNIRLRLIGTSDEEIESPVFSQTGRYTREEIPRLTLEQDIDMFLIRPYGRKPSPTQPRRSFPWDFR